MASSWYGSKWGWGGIGFMLILYFAGVLTIFPIFQAFGSLFIVGTFPILLAITIPFLVIGWFLGILAETIYKKLT